MCNMLTHETRKFKRNQNLLSWHVIEFLLAESIARTIERRNLHEKNGRCQNLQSHVDFDE